MLSSYYFLSLPGGFLARCSGSVSTPPRSHLLVLTRALGPGGVLGVWGRSGLMSWVLFMAEAVDFVLSRAPCRHGTHMSLHFSGPQFWRL